MLVLFTNFFPLPLSSFFFLCLDKVINHFNHLLQCWMLATFANIEKLVRSSTIRGRNCNSTHQQWKSRKHFMLDDFFLLSLTLKCRTFSNWISYHFIETLWEYFYWLYQCDLDTMRFSVSVSHSNSVFLRLLRKEKLGHEQFSIKHVSLGYFSCEWKW